MFPRILSPKLVSAAALAVTASLFAQGPSQDAWREALGPPQGEVPAVPAGEVAWRDDFDAALAEAQAAQRPLLVTWRCLPCKQCAEFDQDVLEGGPELTPLLNQFVTVRMTDAAKLDERYFPYRGYQDLDLSWWVGPNQGKGRMSLRPFMGAGDQQQNNPWHPIGLRPHMEIVEINGRRDDWDSRQLLAWFRLNHKVGDSVTLKTSDERTFEKTIEKSE